MSPPRRRSRRLNTGASSPVKSPSHTYTHLSSLAERDEAPSDPSDAAMAASPKTPASSRAKPSLGEMHPSKVHQSTAQKPDAGLLLGFTDIKEGNRQTGTKIPTPSKVGISSPTFEFQFARPGPQLGPEAQRMMDELREEAIKIKARLAIEREEQRQKEGDAVLEGRKFAKPKGKASRYSDVHMAQFKKMDSIENHPSSFRAQPGRVTPASTNTLKRSQSKIGLNDGPAPTTKTLKRTQSKAKLDDGDISTMNKLKRTQSTARLDDRDADAFNRSARRETTSDRLENTSPAKRARQNISDDASTARLAFERQAAPVTPNKVQSSRQSAINTPTRASLSRAASVRQSPLAATPRGLTKSATVNNIRSLPRSSSKDTLKSPSKFDRMKSIMRNPSFGWKKSPVKPTPTSSQATSQVNKPTAIPPLSRSPSRPNLEKALPSVPTTPIGLERSKSVKHVNFTPDTIKNNVATIGQNSPSPMKSGIPRSTTKNNISEKPIFKPREVQYPSIAAHPALADNPKDVFYPVLSSPRPLPEPPRRSESQRQPSVPGTFTFRADQTIKFIASPKNFGSSPGQASVRQVRPSIMSSMPGSFPITGSNNKENDEVPSIPALPHGMPSKKRRRVDSDDEKEEEQQRGTKKHKTAEGQMLVAPRLVAEKKIETSKGAATNASSPKKKVLSLSRLNMLSKPKTRK